MDFMKWYKSKVVILIIMGTVIIGSVIYGLSFRIRSQMVKSATENVKEIVQVIEASVAEIRKNDVAEVIQLAKQFTNPEDIQTQLAF